MNTPHHKLKASSGKRAINVIRQIRTEQWFLENREAIEATNIWVEKNGLPLARYRVL